MSVLALIPARAGSKGIPGKNFRAFAGGPCLTRLACHAAMDVCVKDVWVTSDKAPPLPVGAQWLQRPSNLAQDDTPMIAVVQHALAQIPGPADQVIVLLQPTQPFRTPSHVRQAIALLRETRADSVVSVVELPKTHSPDVLCSIDDEGSLWPWGVNNWETQPQRRQDAERAYRRDGTAYAFWRKTVARFGSIYGNYVLPLMIPASETCELDTLEDWAAVEARWKAQQHE